jgi:MYXO-CTERM domain-containing protein
VVRGLLKLGFIGTAGCSLFLQSAVAATVVFPSGQDPVPGWLQSSDAVTLRGTGFLGQQFVRVDSGGSVATFLTTSSLQNAVYGMTAALARFSGPTSWVLEVFAGGNPATGAGVPVGSTLLISASGSVPVASTEDAPTWLAQGTGFSTMSPPAGTPLWLRVRSLGGVLGIDSVLGVENVDTNIFFPAIPPTQVNQGNWNFEETPITGAAAPEPVTASLVACGLGALALWRRRRSLQ